MYQEDDYLMISGLQHFMFCKRQWALIHVEQQWAENGLTTDGMLFHKNAHDESKTEKRGAIITVRGLRISSCDLGVSGNCDVVEFHRCDDGVSLHDFKGKWSPVPIEYKMGKPKGNNADAVQLCCEAMCLEEMLVCTIESGYLFYGKTHRRVEVIFSSELRENVKNALAEMHRLMKHKITPKATYMKTCDACSLVDICLPQTAQKQSVDEYLEEVLNSSA